MDELNEWYLDEKERIARGFSPASGADATSKPELGSDEFERRATMQNASAEMRHAETFAERRWCSVIFLNLLKR